MDGVSEAGGCVAEVLRWDGRWKWREGDGMGCGRDEGMGDGRDLKPGRAGGLSALI